MRRVLGLLIAAAAMVGCGAKHCKPEIRTVYVPQEVDVPVPYHVPIDDALTTQHHVAKGPIAECLTIAAARGAELRKCNADKAEIRRVQGTPAPPPARAK